MTYVCPVCGYDKLDEPSYYSNNDASYELCSCCGFQFGVDDDVEINEGQFLTRIEAHTLYRNNWIEDGAKVFSAYAFEPSSNENESLEKNLLIKQLKMIHVYIDREDIHQ